MKKTFEEKGLGHVSKLALQNCLDLLEIIAWNHEQDIQVYRMTSKIFPWAGHYALEDLPDYSLIYEALEAAGELARAAEQRITNHPSHFVKLASNRDAIIQSSITELEIQSHVFNIMGLSASPWNKVRAKAGRYCRVHEYL